MPNHVTNIISFKDISDERVKDILEAIKIDEVGIGSIDFNKLIPMPDDIFKGDLGPEDRETGFDLNSVTAKSETLVPTALTR